MTYQDSNMPADDDTVLFRQAMGDVTPVTSDRVTWHGPRPAPLARQTELDNARVLDELLSVPWQPDELETGEELWFRRPGLQRSVLSRLRRGHYSVQAQLDLHGMTVPVARAAVARFLYESRGRHLRCVRIVHGKGHGSPAKQPVLKSKVSHWLQRRDEVLAFCSAHPADGGTGALYVLLRHP
jgi:DNA-nicking Smr family endonuclease